MADWLLAHQVALQSYLLLASFGGVAVWESFLPRRPFAVSLGQRWFSNLALTGLGIALVRLCLPVAAISFAVLVEQRGWGLLNAIGLPGWWSCAIGVVLIDLAGYAQHRVFHAIPLLWRFHQIHHCDLDVDCGTAIRHHPVETLLGAGLDLLLIAAFGIPALAVLLATILMGVASVFNHGNVALSPAADRRLRYLVVTPDMHRIHHSALVAESNQNFAMLLSWWDHLFSTYHREPILGHERMELGIAEARNASDLTLVKLISLPFRRARASGMRAVDLTLPRPSM